MFSILLCHRMLFSFLCVKSKLEKLQSHKIVAIMLHKFVIPLSWHLSFKLIRLLIMESLVKNYCIFILSGFLPTFKVCKKWSMSTPRQIKYGGSASKPTNIASAWEILTKINFSEILRASIGFIQNQAFFGFISVFNPLIKFDVWCFEIIISCPFLLFGAKQRGGGV